MSTAMNRHLPNLFRVAATRLDIIHDGQVPVRVDVIKWGDRSVSKLATEGLLWLIFLRQNLSRI